MVAPFMASIVGLPAEILLRYMTRITGELSLWPLANADFSFTKTSLIVSYTVIVCATIYMWRRTGHEFRDFNVVE